MDKLRKSPKCDICKKGPIIFTYPEILKGIELGNEDMEVLKSVDVIRVKCINCGVEEKYINKNRLN